MCIYRILKMIVFLTNKNCLYIYEKTIEEKK